MPRRAGAPSRREKSERLIQVAGNALDPHGAGAGGRQLDRKGKPVESSADVFHETAVALVEAETRVRQTGELREEPDRIAVGLVPVEREGLHPEHRLPRHREGFSTGGQDLQVGARRKQLGGQGGGGLDHVLAIVEDEQSRHAGQRRGDADHVSGRSR